MFTIRRFGLISGALALVAAPAFAGDFTGWTQPTLPAGCHMKIERVYQAADGQPIHAIVLNTGPQEMKAKLVARLTVGKSIILDGANVDAAAGKRVDVIVQGTPRGGTAKDSIQFVVQSCK